MTNSTQAANLIGAVVANLNNILLIALFLSRLGSKSRIEHWLGIIIILSIVLLCYLLKNSGYASLWIIPIVVGQ